MSRERDDSPGRASVGSLASDDGSQILHIDGLTRSVTNQHLKEIFGTFGPVTTVELAVDTIVGLSNGWAHVEFTSKKDAEEAQLRMDGGIIDGKRIRVNFVLVRGRKRSRSGSPVERIESQISAVRGARQPSPPSSRAGAKHSRRSRSGSAERQRISKRSKSPRRRSRSPLYSRDAPLRDNRRPDARSRSPRRAHRMHR